MRNISWVFWGCIAMCGAGLGVGAVSYLTADYPGFAIGCFIAAFGAVLAALQEEEVSRIKRK